MPLPGELIPIIKIVVGLALIFIAAKVVGFIIKVTGIAFLGYGAFQYLQSSAVTLEVIFPAIVGLALIVVGKGMAQTVIKVVGALVILWGIAGLGII